MNIDTDPIRTEQGDFLVSKQCLTSLEIFLKIDLIYLRDDDELNDFEIYNRATSVSTQ